MAFKQRVSAAVQMSPDGPGQHFWPRLPQVPSPHEPFTHMVEPQLAPEAWQMPVTQQPPESQAPPEQQGSPSPPQVSQVPGAAPVQAVPEAVHTLGVFCCGVWQHA